MWMIKYCGSWNYKPQAESLSAEMKELGFSVTIEEGEKGQFELFNLPFQSSDIPVSFLKAGHGKFITLREFELALSGS